MHRAEMHPAMSLACSFDHPDRHHGQLQCAAVLAPPVTGFWVGVLSVSVSVSVCLMVVQPFDFDAFVGVTHSRNLVVFV